MAVNLDELSAWGTLASSLLNSLVAHMDAADSLSFQNATATPAATSATVSQPTIIKFKSMSGTASTSASATASTGRTKGMIAASTSAAGTVTATAFLIRLVNGQPTANVSVTATATHVQAMASVAAVTYTVTVANVGGVNVYVLNGANNPTLSLLKGHVYIFDVSDATVSGHPLRFRTSGDLSFTGGVNVIGTAGTSGAKVEFIVKNTAPASLKYYCTVHGNAMGNTISVSASTNTPAVAAAETNTPTALFVVNATASAATSASATGQPSGILFFSGAAAITSSAAASASARILGEDWFPAPAGATGVWLNQ